MGESHDASPELTVIGMTGRVVTWRGRDHLVRRVLAVSQEIDPRGVQRRLSRGVLITWLFGVGH